MRRTDWRKDCVFQNVDPHERGSFPGSSAPWSPALALVGFVGLCLLVAAANAALITSGGASWYLSLNQPPGMPPSVVFSPAWTALYILIGIAGWLVWRRVGAARPLRLWGWQLLLNALWLPAFFGLHSVALGVVVVVPLLLLIALTIQAFARVKPIAAWLMAPYFACAAYGTYLSIGFWWLNHA